MSVMIGVDPHKATHTAVAIDSNETELDRKKVRATIAQVDQLLAWAEPLGPRTWAIESANGLGYLLSQQLVAAGETVARRARHVGVEDTGAGRRADRTRTTRTTPCRSRSLRCDSMVCAR